MSAPAFVVFIVAACCAAGGGLLSGVFADTEFVIEDPVGQNVIQVVRFEQDAPKLEPLSTLPQQQQQRNNLEHYFRTYLSWLTPAQRVELRRQRAIGTTRRQIIERVQHAFVQLAIGSERRERATLLLKAACERVNELALGRALAQQLKAAVDNGRRTSVEAQDAAEELVLESSWPQIDWQWPPQRPHQQEHEIIDFDALRARYQQRDEESRWESAQPPMLDRDAIERAQQRVWWWQRLPAHKKRAIALHQTYAALCRVVAAAVDSELPSPSSPLSTSQNIAGGWWNAQRRTRKQQQQQLLVEQALIQQQILRHHQPLQESNVVVGGADIAAAEIAGAQPQQQIQQQQQNGGAQQHQPVLVIVSGGADEAGASDEQQQQQQQQQQMLSHNNNNPNNMNDIDDDERQQQPQPPLRTSD